MAIFWKNYETGDYSAQYCENPDCGKHITITIRVHWHADDPYRGDLESPFKRYSCGRAECARVVDALPFREPELRHDPPPNPTIVGEETVP